MILRLHRIRPAFGGVAELGAAVVGAWGPESGEPGEGAAGKESVLAGCDSRGKECGECGLWGREGGVGVRVECGVHTDIFETEDSRAT